LSALEAPLNVGGHALQRGCTLDQRAAHLFGVLVVVYQFADQTLSTLDMREDGVGLVQGRQESVGNALFGLGSAGQLAQQPLAAVDAGKNVFHGIRNLHEVVDQILARRNELVDVALSRRWNERARLE